MSYLQLLTGTGATRKFWLPNGEEVEGWFEYWLVDWFTEDDVVIGDKEDGWYLRDGEGQLYCMNSIPVPFGSQIMIDCADEEAAVVFNGQVAKKDQPVALAYGDFNYTGNCTPANLTLGDIYVNENYSLSYLQFLTGTGATKSFLLPNGEEVEGWFEYWLVDWFTEEDVVVGEKKDGWYLRDSEGQLYCMNSLPIAAGTGFMVDCADEDAEVIIPSALNK